MIVRERQTDLLIQLKSTVRLQEVEIQVIAMNKQILVGTYSEEHDIGWLHWVLVR